MAKITFSQSNTAGDIPNYEYSLQELKDGHFTDVYEMLENTDDTVFVCFQSFSEDKECTYEQEHPDILVTGDKESAELYFNYVLNERGNEPFNFNFFCFTSFEEAFRYCTDLKEGL